VQSQLSVTTEPKTVGNQTKFLTLRLATSISEGGVVDLRIRSPLKVSAGSAVSVPAIALESLSQGRRYLGVSESVDSQPIRWTERGVRPATVPTNLRPTAATTPATRFYEIVSDPFQVVSRPGATPELAPQIRLADTTVIANDHGAQRITTRLILAPHGLSECTLQFPPQQTLISTQLGGRPATIRQIDPTRWQIALATSQLPQSIEIVSRSSGTDAPGHSITLERPALLARGQPIPAEMSLWSFVLPNNSATRTVIGADATSEGEQAALRFDRLVSIAEAAKATAADLPSPDGYNWFVPWARLLTETGERTERTSAAAQIPRVESQVSHPATDQIAQAGARLEKWLADCRKLFGGANREKAIDVDTANSADPTSAAFPASAWSYYVAEGGNERLALTLEPTALSPNQSRAIGLLTVFAAMIASLWLMRRPAALDFLHRWPQLMGVLLGIAWWAWLWPSWLGILMAGASVWLALRFAWPGRSLRTEASTVLRTSRTS
jgi:hypothetical protein